MKIALTWHPLYMRVFFSTSSYINELWFTRMTLFRQLLVESGLLECCVEVFEPRVAPWEHLEWIHSREYLSKLEGLNECKVLDADTMLCPEGVELLKVIVGGEELLIDKLLSGRFRVAYQPYGGLHHARRDRGAGFCPVNDIAVVIEYARRVWIVERIAVVDIDVHHGDGTQEIFWEDPRVLTISFHGYAPGFYPGTGSYRELGGGEAKGTKLNVPLPAGTGDEAFLAVFERLVPEALKMFKPGLVILQAGVDGHYLDTLSILSLTTHAYLEATKTLKQVCEEMGVPLLALGGGGYSLGAPRAMVAVLAGLMGGLGNLPDEVGENVKQLMDPEPTHDPSERVDTLTQLAELLLEKLEEVLAPSEEEEQGD